MSETLHESIASQLSRPNLFGWASLILAGLTFLFGAFDLRSTALVLAATGFLAAVIGLGVAWRTRRGWLVSIVGLILCPMFFMNVMQWPSVERLNRIACSGNLRRIGEAIEQYANANKGRLPPDLNVLCDTTGLDARVLICPTRKWEAKPTHPEGDYLYYGAGRDFRSISADAILACDRATNHELARNSGANVLLGDLSVSWFPADWLEKELAKKPASTRPKQE